MIITCKACSTSFNLDDKMLKPTGSKVRCSVCANVFTVFPEQAPLPASTDDLTEPAAALGASIQGKTDMADASPDTVTEEKADTGDANDEIDDAVSKALGDDLGDLTFESGDTDDNNATMIADLEDDDFELDLSSEPADDDLSATIVADLDDDEFDLSVDEPPDSEATVIVDLDGEDFDLDIPPATDDDQDSVTMVITDLDDDEALDLDDDFSLEFEADTKTADASDPALTESGDDLDLSLDLEIGDDVLPTEEPVSESADTALDDLALDFDLETDTETEAKPATDEAGAGDDEMDLALDLEDDGIAEDKQADASPVLEDDLDMSSLEDLFDEEGADDGVTMIVDVDELSDVALELDDEPSTDGAGESDALDETLADLELELDEEQGKTEVSDVDDSDNELDFSEIEKMLEEPQAGGQKISVPEQDLDLDIEASLETEKWMSESGKDSPLVADEEFDLSELEQVLEDVDTSADDDTAEEQELELDLDDQSEGGKPTETVAVDNDLDFDLSDFEDDVPAKSETGEASREAADMELEFEVDEDGEDAQAMADDGLDETVAIAEATAVPAQEKIAEPVATTPAVSKPRPVKKGTSKSLVFLLILIILGGAGYGTYYYLDKSGIEIPFISDYLKPKVQDPGNLKLTTYDINSRFVDNANVGKLFVITGKVKNGYTESRGMVTIVGKIFSSGKVPIHEEIVYCGNVMSDLELANLEWDKIQARLANRLGDNRSNVKIEPGKSIPFMAVFSGLPEDLEEFTIEVTGSTSLK
jgi:pilus assembly protein FimV